MRVLVTGAGGFTGRYLMDRLAEQGDEPHSLQADLRDPVAMAREVAAIVPQAVIHLAALAFVASQDYAAFYSVNQVGTFALLDAVAEQAPGIPVLLASTAQVYGGDASGLVAEDRSPAPGNHYGLSKYAMEIGAGFLADKLRLIVARPFNYTGVGQEERYLIPKIVAHFRRREPVIELGNLHVRRDFGDVRSVVDAYCRLLHADLTESVYNVSTARLNTIGDILAILQDMTGHRIDVRTNPAFVRANDVEALGGDNKRLRDALPGWAPNSLNETLRWMIEAPESEWAVP
jgi:nucleoside-diphosphate-sugar epimerase